MHLLFRSARLLQSPARWRCAKSFSTTSNFNLRTTELQDSNFSSLRTDASRLWSDIHSTAEFGKGTVYGDLPEKTGLSRLALSQSDKQARDWFVDMTKSLGCDVKIDQIGNIFAIRKGLRNDSPPTFVGSHLDSQPNGGRFDGVLGVCAGVEMLRVFNDNWIETEAPVGIVNWTNEEGARWTKSMMGSGVWAGASSLEKIWEMQDRNSVSVKEALESIGYLGEVGVGEDRVKMAGHFELHIEQGKVLENNQEVVGVVEGAQAYKWFTVTVEGKDSHAGATAMRERCDAMRATASLLKSWYKCAETFEGLVTVGKIWIDNGSVNTVPGKVVLTLDVRHHDDAKLERLMGGLTQTSRMIKGSTAKMCGSSVRITMKEDFASQAVKFNVDAMGCIKEGAKNVFGGSKEMRLMTSGAGHDSVNTNLHCPTAMIFVQCRDGVTHNPEEWCSQEDAKIGTDVLIESVLRFDRLRFQNRYAGAISLDREL